MLAIGLHSATIDTSTLARELRRKRLCDTIPLGQTERAISMIQRTDHLYIVTDESILSGEPIIVGTRTPVRAIVELWRQGLAPETIPNHLSR